MSRPDTQIERLTRIETILEEAFKEGGTVSEIKSDIKSIKTDLAEDVADLARLKHRGAGILVGVSLTFTAIGVLLSSWVKEVIRAIF